MRTVDEIKADIKLCSRNEFPELLAELWLSLTKDIDIDRLAEICAAEQDGRCVVLPCKVGDTVFQIKYDCAKGLRYNPFWNYGCSTDVICAKCETYPCDLHKTVFKVTVEDKEWIWKNADAFGKTIFIDRAEAEAALKGAEK